MNQVKYNNADITSLLMFGSSFCLESDNAINPLYESNILPNPLTYPVHLGLNPNQLPKIRRSKTYCPSKTIICNCVSHGHTPAG